MPGVCDVLGVLQRWFEAVEGNCLGDQGWHHDVLPEHTDDNWRTATLHVRSLTSLRHACVCCIALMIRPSALLIPAGVATSSAAGVDVKRVREACLLDDGPEGGFCCGATTDVSCIP